MLNSIRMNHCRVQIGTSGSVWPAYSMLRKVQGEQFSSSGTRGKIFPYTALVLKVGNRAITNERNIAIGYSAAVYPAGPAYRRS